MNVDEIVLPCFPYIILFWDWTIWQLQHTSTSSCQRLYPNSIGFLHIIQSLNLQSLMVTLQCILHLLHWLIKPFLIDPHF